jgi:hypothetical protein
MVCTNEISWIHQLVSIDNLFCIAVCTGSSVGQGFWAKYSGQTKNGWVDGRSCWFLPNTSAVYIVVRQMCETEPCAQTVGGHGTTRQSNYIYTADYAVSPNQP